MHRYESKKKKEGKSKTHLCSSVLEVLAYYPTGIDHDSEGKSEHRPSLERGGLER